MGANPFDIECAGPIVAVSSVNISVHCSDYWRPLLGV
jgi:hypothetical protein